jgi:ABC-type microcin C transport system permease subunit YejB
MTEFSMIIAICNAMEAFLFGMFTVIMLVEQIQAIFENVSYIDSLKNVKGNQRTRMEGLEQVFGEPFSYRWFLPVPITVRLLAEFKRFGELENGTAGLMSSAGDDEDESYELQKTA